MSTEHHLAPVSFDEPWQAEIFALTTSLNETGIFTWGQWGDRFGAALAKADVPIEGGRDYYLIWLETLMQLLIDLGHATSAEVESIKTQWITAYEQTPHGQPVVLNDQ